MKTKIYLVKYYLRFDDDVTPIREMRNKALPFCASESREEAAQDVRQFVMKEKRRLFDNYKKYWFIQEIELDKDLSNY